LVSGNHHSHQGKFDQFAEADLGGGGAGNEAQVKAARKSSAGFKVKVMHWTRREFAKLGGLGIAARFAPALAAQPAGRPTGYAIIGLGRIAAIFMSGIRNSSNSRVVALVSGHPDKALRIAADYRVPENSIYNYDNFDSIATNQQVDAVYVALPNSMHAEYTIRAAKAGKHVLCEKPMANSVAQCEQMIASCKSAGVKLMIGYRCQYDPTHLKAIDLIRSGAIGQLQAIESAFGFNIQPGEWRLDKKMAGGGPLVDVGIYSLNATRFLTGEEPGDFKAYTSTIDHDGRFTTVEENVSWTMKFPSGIMAACNTTYGGQMEGFYRVHGAKGWIEVSSAFVYEGLRLRAEYFAADGAAPTRLDEPNPAHIPYQFQTEAEHFSHCIQNGVEPKTPGEEGLRDMRYIAEIYKTAAAS
jgi:predicted dehydrogenase